MPPTNLRIPASDLPPHWSEREADGVVYAHAHLAAAVTVRETDEGPYQVLVGDGTRRRRLRPPEDPATAEEAVDWAVALMRQTDRECGPDCRDPVGAALRRVRGEPAAADESPREGDDRVCLLCGAPLAPFRGADTAARFASHVRYVDDATHADAARYLADPTAYVERAEDRG